MTYSALCFICGEPGGTHLICRELYKSQTELNEINNGGKTLRDEFAMAALDSSVMKCSKDTFVEDRIKNSATLAYEIADAMLEARKAKGE